MGLTRKIVAEVIRRSGIVGGHTKLLNLLFFLQYDLSRKGGKIHATKHLCDGEPLVGSFIVWSTGLLSGDVYEILDSLESELLVSIDREVIPCDIKWTGDILPEIPRSVAARIDALIREYEGTPGWRLARKASKLLGLDIPEKRTEFIGVPVDKYLEIEGAVVREVDLAEG